MTEIDLGDKDVGAYERHETDYMAGGCDLMAVALHEIYGLPVQAAWDPDAEDGRKSDPGGLVHFFVRVDDDRAMDLRGVQRIEDMTQEWGFDPTDLVFTDHDSGALLKRFKRKASDVEKAKSAFQDVFPRSVPDISPTP